MLPKAIRAAAGPVVVLGRGQRWGCKWFARTDGHIVRRGARGRRGVHSGMTVLLKASRADTE